MITSMELEWLRLTPVEWDLGIVLSKTLTYKTVFLLAVASAGRCSELHGLVFYPKYIQLKLQGVGVTLYFSPE